MADQDDRTDRLADRNLRMIGQRLPLPADPTEQQRLAWKQASIAARAAESVAYLSLPQRGVRFIRRHRLLTMATPAVAASIVLLVLLVTPRGAVVEASTIFDSLRQTLLDGFQITFENIGQDGIRADGKVVVALEPFGGGRAAAGAAFGPDALEPASVYLEVRLWGDDSHAAAAGLDVQLVVALSEQAQWVYFKTVSLPQKLLEQEPLARLLAGVAHNGVLLELDGLIQNWPRRDRANGQAADEGRVVSVDDGAPVAISDETEPFARLQIGDDAEAEQLLKDILTGRASGEQINELSLLLAETAQTVSVVEKEAGLYVLNARDFKLDRAQAGAAEWLPKMALRVTYRQGTGIESADIMNIGQYGGALRITPLDGTLREDLFNARRLIEPGATMAWDLSGLEPMLNKLLSNDR